MKILTYTRLTALMLALFTLTAFAACGEGDGVSPTDAAPTADYDGAKATLVAYFDGFDTHSAEALADVMLSEPVLALVTREKVVETMQSNIDSLASRFGDFRVKYDPAEFTFEEASEEELVGIRGALGIADGAEKTVDRLCTGVATVAFYNADSTFDSEAGGMWLYLYDGKWYVYSGAAAA